MAKIINEDGTVSYDNDKHYQECQQKYLETGDIKCLWEAYNDIIHAIKSCMVKRLKGKKVAFFNEKAEDAAIYFIDLMKRKPRKIERLMGYASYLAMMALYGSPLHNDWEEWNLTNDTIEEDLIRENEEYEEDERADFED